MMIRTLFSMLLLTTATSAMAAISFRQPYVIDSSVGVFNSEASVFTERSGSNVGRMHVVYVELENGGDSVVMYTREANPGQNNFITPIKISTTATPSVDSPDITVDSEGQAHICYVGTDDGGDEGVYYARVSSGGSVSLRNRATPSSVTQASFPAIAVTKLSSSGSPRAFIAYVGPDPFAPVGQVDTELLVLSQGSNGSFSTTQLNLTDDLESGETNVDFDLVRGLSTSSFSNVVQGAIVFQKGQDIYVYLTSGSTDTGPVFLSTPQLITSDIVGFRPALAVQSISEAGNGYVGHLVFASGVEGVSTMEYVQFARLPDTSSFNVERLTAEFQTFSASYPSIAVVPDTVVDDRFNKPVSIGWVGSNQLEMRRNSGGLSNKFAITGGTLAKPISFFNDNGSFPLSGGTAAEGPGLVSTLRYNNATRSRMVVTNAGQLAVVNEQQLPVPTATATPSPTATTTVPTVTTTIPQTTTVGPTASPSPSPTASPTATGPTPSPSPSPSPSPTVVIVTTAPPTVPPTLSPTPSATAIITPTLLPSPTPGTPTPSATPRPINEFFILDTLLDYRQPTEAQKDEGDKNGDGIWDVADMWLFILE